MKITQKQVQMMYQVLLASLSIVNGVAYSQDQRIKLANEIINQQDNKKLLDLAKKN